jgi:hypothetical protein
MYAKFRCVRQRRTSGTWMPVGRRIPSIAVQPAKDCRPWNLRRAPKPGFPKVSAVEFRPPRPRPTCVTGPCLQASPRRRGRRRCRPGRDPARRKGPHRDAAPSWSRVSAAEGVLRARGAEVRLAVDALLDLGPVWRTSGSPTRLALGPRSSAGPEQIGRGRIGSDEQTPGRPVGGNPVSTVRRHAPGALREERPALGPHLADVLTRCDHSRRRDGRTRQGHQHRRHTDGSPQNGSANESDA